MRRSEGEEIDRYLHEYAANIIKSLKDALGEDFDNAAICTLIEYILEQAGFTFQQAVAILEVIKFKLLLDANILAIAIHSEQ